MNWKTCSVEAVAGIGKLRRLGDVSARSLRAGASCRNPEPGFLAAKDLWRLQPLPWVEQALPDPNSL